MRSPTNAIDSRDKLTQPLAAARARIGVGGRVAHLPVLTFAQHRLARVHSTSMVQVPPVVSVAHQCAAVPTDLAGDLDSASHWRCTSRSAVAAEIAEGANTCG